MNENDGSPSSFYFVVVRKAIEFLPIVTQYNFWLNFLIYNLKSNLNMIMIDLLVLFIDKKEITRMPQNIVQKLLKKKIQMSIS